MVSQAGVSAIMHSVVCYRANPTSALKAFSGPEAPPAHALLAHTYGVKNIYTGLIRLYAAYHITNPQIYNLATFTFVGVIALYAGETFVYRTARMREASFAFVTAGTGLVWMLAQRSWYLQA